MGTKLTLFVGLQCYPCHKWPLLAGGNGAEAQIPEPGHLVWVLSYVRPAGAWSVRRVQNCTSACSSASLFQCLISWGKGSKDFMLLGREFGSKLVSPIQGLEGTLPAHVQMGKLILHLKTVTRDAFMDLLVWDNSVEMVAYLLPVSGYCHIPGE